MSQAAQPRPSAHLPEAKEAEAVSAVDAHGHKVQAMFTDIAPGYDRANRLMSMGTDIRWRRKAVDELLPDPGPGNDGAGKKILDLCAGTLDSSLEIQRRYRAAEICAGDFSEGMLEVGRKRLHGAARRQIEAIQMDAHDLPCEDQSFDAVFCAFGARNLSDLPRAVSEMARVLKPGGRLRVLDFFRPQSLFTKLFHGAYNHSVLPVVGWACTGNLEAYRYLPRSMSAFVNAIEFEEMLRANGFGETTARGLSFGIAGLVEGTRVSTPQLQAAAQAKAVGA